MKDLSVVIGWVFLQGGHFTTAGSEYPRRLKIIILTTQIQYNHVKIDCNAPPQQSRKISPGGQSHTTINDNLDIFCFLILHKPKRLGVGLPEITSVVVMNFVEGRKAKDGTVCVDIDGIG